MDLDGVALDLGVESVELLLQLRLGQELPGAREERFEERPFRKGGARQVWLAGGIGITPFLAWAESLTEADSRDIHLIHCVRTQEEAIGLETLRAAAARNPRFSFEVVATARDGRLTAERLISTAPFTVRQADLWFCGPTGLKDGVLKGLKAEGQTPRRVRFEQFEFA